MRHPLLIPLASAAAGLVSAALLAFDPPLWGITALLSCVLVASFAKSATPFLMAVAFTFYLWGAFSLDALLHRGNPWERYADGRPWVIEGVVVERPVGKVQGGRVLLEVRHLYRWGVLRPLRERLLVYVGNGRLTLLSGDTVRFSSRLRLPRRLGLPGEADYPFSLALKGVGATAFVPEADALSLVAAGCGWRHELDRLAATLGRFIERSQPGETGGILKALLLGDMSEVPPELNDSYARSGVNHILSISGFHVGILYLCLFQVLSFLGRMSEAALLRLNLKRVLLVAALPVTVFYLFLSGCAPATVRSVLMIGCLAVALYIKRETDPLNVIMVAACAIIGASPQTLFDVSFQLSFLAIWGLVVLTPLFAYPFRGIKGRWRVLPLSLAASLAAIAATAVPVAYYFHRLPVAGLACNLIVVPLLGYGAVVLGFAALLFVFPLPYLADGLLWLAGHLVRLSDRVILLFAKVPVMVWQPDRLDLVLALLALVSLTLIPSRLWRGAACLSLVCLLSLRAIVGNDASGRPGELTVTFLSVGQGDAALVRLPDGKTMLVDGGGSFGDDARVGERLLVPALLTLGVRRIDYLVLSHPHPDHFQGLLAAAADFEVGEFWESGCGSELPEYLKLKWILSARGVPVIRLGGWVPSFPAGGALVESLWPPAPTPAPSGDANDASLVLRVSYGASSVLFTGDLGGDAEEELMERGAPLGCTLLKVGHHGSRRSSTTEFLTRCHPRAAVISAGYGNYFGLPAQATLVRLARAGVRVYRTDLDGSVKAELRRDGSCLVATPWQGAF